MTEGHHKWISGNLAELSTGPEITPLHMNEENNKETKAGTKELVFGVVLN